MLERLKESGGNVLERLLGFLAEQPVLAPGVGSESIKKAVNCALDDVLGAWPELADVASRVREETKACGSIKPRVERQQRRRF